MQTFVTNSITAAACSAGLPQGRVINLTKKDNLTIARPRIELQFLPEKYTRTGRKLALHRTKTEQIRKRELYEVVQTVNANVLAEDQQWLDLFSVDFVDTLATGENDSRGNWVKIRVQEATFGRAPDKRLGTAVISVLTKINRLFVVSFTWRVTREDVERLIPTFTINPTLF